MSHIRTSMLSLLLVFGLWIVPSSEEQLWEQDMTQDVYIDAGTEGFRQVSLECLADQRMTVTLDMEEGFEGVFYTRGSYKSAKPPCYFDATGEKTLKLSFSYDQCQQKDAKAEPNVHNRTVIAQFDDWLIFPGDLAFEIVCEVKDEQTVASISLADPDPGAKPLPKHRKSTVNAPAKVVFTPDDIRPKKNKKKNVKKQKNAKSEL